MDNLTILTSVIGASAATIGVVVAKDTKVSEFRQAWVDALREDISRFVALAFALNAVQRSLAEQASDTPTSEAYAALVLEMNQVLTRIRLRLDITKTPHKSLDTLCGKLVFVSAQPNQLLVVSEKAEDLCAAARAVLDEAWTRVKRGERRFRWTFYLAGGTLASSLAVLFVHWYSGGHHW